MQIDYSYLKPPKEAYNIVHDENYIVHGSGPSHVRKIFYNQRYDEYEEQKILELKQLIQENQVILPNDWTNELTCKYVYSGGFNGKKSLDRLKKHLEWREDPKYQILTPIAEELLKKGYVYCFGRDKQYRPVIYIHLYQVQKDKIDVQDLLCSSTALMKIVQQYMQIKGIIENWIVILDLNGSGIFDTNFTTLQKINEILSINYTSTLHKMFILNPSFFFHATWKLAEKIIHPETTQKINFLKKSEYYKLFDHIDPSQIEEKYGGTHKNLEVYWPIQSSLDIKHALMKQSSSTQELIQKVDNQQTYKESEFYSIENDSRAFFDLQFITKKKEKENQVDMKASQLYSDPSFNQIQFNTPGTDTSNTEACCQCRIY